MDRAKLFPLLKGVLVLAVIALCSGLLLGFFNHITYVDPLQSTLDGFRKDSGATGEFTMVLDEKTASGSGTIIYYAVSETDGIHAFLASAVSQRGGEFQLFVYIRDDKIYKIVVGENNDEYVSELEKANFFERFIGIEISELDPQLGGDVVTGATYTSEAVKNAIDAVVQYYNELTEEGSHEQA